MELKKAVEIVDTNFKVNESVFLTEFGKRLDNEAYIAKLRVKLLDFASLFVALSRNFPTKYQFCRELITKMLYKLSRHIETSQVKQTEKLASKLISDMNTLRTYLAICEAYNLFKRKIEDRETGDIDYIDNKQSSIILNNKLLELEVLVIGRAKNMRKIANNLKETKDAPNK